MPDKDSITLEFTCTQCSKLKGIADKSKRSSRCEECEIAFRKIKYAENADKRREYTANWKKNNPEKARAAVDKWHSDPKNQERRTAYRREYYLKNKEARKVARKEEYANNREKALKQARDWAIANRDRVRRSTNANNAKNRDRRRELVNAYNSANREAYRAVRSARKARARGAEGRFTKDDVKQIAEKQHNKCATCKTSLKAGCHIDHIHPLILGGTNWPDNIQLLCPTCNLSKGGKDPFQWANENGRLF